MNIRPLFSLLIMSALVLYGCGDQENASGAAGRQEVTNKPSYVDESVGDDAATDEKTDEAAAEQQQNTEARRPEKQDAATGRAAGEDLEEEGVSQTNADFEAAFDAIVELEKNTEFGEALTMCRELLRDYRGGAEERRLKKKMAELNQYAARAANLRYAMQRMGPENPPEARSFARKELLRAGELGRIFLRKAIRDVDPVDLAAAAAETLADAGEKLWLPFFADQLVSVQNETLLKTLVESVIANAEDLSVPAILDLLAFMQRPDSQPYRDKLDRALIERISAGGFERETLAAFLRRVQEDDNLSYLREAHLLSMVYAYNAWRQDDKFTEILGAEAPLPILRNYAERASVSGQPKATALAETISPLLAPYDYEALKKGLVASWSFEGIAHGAAKDLSGNGHQIVVKGADSITTGEGFIGRAPIFEHDSRHVETANPRHEKISKIQNGSYTFTAWIKPSSLPDGEQPDPFWGIVMKEGWHLGLSLVQNGRISLMHYYDEKKGTSPSTERTCEPGKWHHTAGTVDQETGTIRVYLDGLLDGAGRFPPNSGAWNRYERQPIRIGAARSEDRDWACRFNGMIDEVRVYNRALSKIEIKALYSMRTEKADEM